MSSTLCPPISSWLCMLLMRCSRWRLCSFSTMNSRLRCSSAVMAASLSASARFFCSSSSSSRRLSTRSLLRWASSCLSLRSSRSYFLRRVRWSISSLTVAMFLMFFARLANLSVDSDSGKASSAGEIMHIIVVLQFPPRLSSRMRVSLESRYGMCCRCLVSVRAPMTLPSALSDWLIFFDSSSRLPVAPVMCTRSLPARSTRFILPTLTLSLVGPALPLPVRGLLLLMTPMSCSFCAISPLSSSSAPNVTQFSTMTRKTACEREDISFIFVAPVVRIVPPRSMRL
mmetsp:Transcript_35864/g.101528  ORF Transcript_35864/g.101528 Transcript_35864/m.101528 type:complete len:285 (+) Transcript_35864:1544-2398(+)